MSQEEEMQLKWKIYLPSLTLTRRDGCVKFPWGNYVNKPLVLHGFGGHILCTSGPVNLVTISASEESVSGC